MHLPTVFVALAGAQLAAAVVTFYGRQGLAEDRLECESISVADFELADLIEEKLGTTAVRSDINFGFNESLTCDSDLVMAISALCFEMPDTIAHACLHQNLLLNKSPCYRDTWRKGIPPAIVALMAPAHLPIIIIYQTLGHVHQDTRQKRAQSRTAQSHTCVSNYAPMERLAIAKGQLATSIAPNVCYMLAVRACAGAL